MKYAPPAIASMLLCACCLGVHAQKMIDPSDIANVKQVTDPQISPDGKEVAYVVTTPVDPGKHKDAHIWLFKTDMVGDAIPFVFSSGSDTTPRWSPDGNTIAFLSDRKNPLSAGKVSPFHFSIADAANLPDLANEEDRLPQDEEDPGMQLWIISVRGGEATPLTDIPGGIKSFKWSPNGKSLAFVRRDQETKAERYQKKKKNDQIPVNEDYKYDRLWFYDLSRKEASVITAPPLNIDDFDWSPDGTQFVARVSPTPRMDDYWRVSKIVVLDAKTGAISKTLEERAGYIQPRWSPDGRRIAFSKETQKGITDVHVIYDRASGNEFAVEDKFSGSVKQLFWSADSKSVLAQAIDGAHTLVIRVDAITGAVMPLQGSEGSDGSLTLSADGSRFAYLQESMRQPADVWLYDGGKARAMTRTNPQVEGWKLGTEREIEWKSSKDEKTIHGVLLLPPGYEAGKRYPTIVHVHGGPEEAWTTGWHGSWYNYAAMISSHGYVVLLPNPRGSDGAGPNFTEANYQDWGGGDYQDVMDGVDSLIAQGITDAGRMGMGGWSFGGFMTSWTVTHTNRFKAGMVGAGVTDLYSMATTTDISPSFQNGYFGPFAASRKLYDAHSPVRYIDQCHTPVLVLHGEADPRVPISQGEEFYNGLRLLGRDVRMVRYPREPHIFTEREHQIDSLGRILAWYDSHLK
jgi:dipeptidyl aminopeptidase/acylaminoacyl peptidase